jgi:hypothetical protein
VVFLLEKLAGCTLFVIRSSEHAIFLAIFLVDLFFEDFSGCCQPAPPKFCLAVKAFKNFHPKKLYLVWRTVSGQLEKGFMYSVVVLFKNDIRGCM